MMRLGSCGPKENGTLDETETFYVVSSWIIIIVIIIIAMIMVIILAHVYLLLMGPEPVQRL